jgi:hypothetical protein
VMKTTPPLCLSSGGIVSLKSARFKQSAVGRRSVPEGDYVVDVQVFGFRDVLDA